MRKADLKRLKKAGFIVTATQLPLKLEKLTAKEKYDAKCLRIMRALPFRKRKKQHAKIKRFRLRQLMHFKYIKPVLIDQSITESPLVSVRGTLSIPHQPELV